MGWDGLNWDGMGGHGMGCIGIGWIGCGVQEGYRMGWWDGTGCGGVQWGWMGRDEAGLGSYNAPPSSQEERSHQQMLEDLQEELRRSKPELEVPYSHHQPENPEIDFSFFAASPM